MLAILLAALVSVSGTVTDRGGAPLPGVVVKLDAVNLDAKARQTVSDVQGRYTFEGVSEGQHEVRYWLPGFEESVRTFSARETSVEVTPQALRVSPIEAITLSCAVRSCLDSVPETSYDPPLCSEYELNDALMEAVRTADRSARDLLRSRYAQTFSRYERHRIAGALLGKLADDSAIARDLLQDAEICVRFPRVDDEVTPQFIEWCAARGLPAEDHWSASFDALAMISNDPRSRALLVKAIESADRALVDTAIAGLAEQRDASALPAIERAIVRYPDDPWVAMMLVSYRTEAADQIALKYLQGEEREEYLRMRSEPPAEVEP